MAYISGVIAFSVSSSARNALSNVSSYNSKSEVLREGVRLIQDRETRLAALDASIAWGLADVDIGQVRPADEVFGRLEAKYKAMGSKPE